MHVDARLPRFDFDPERFRKLLDETLQAQLRQAARAWLRAVLTKVPVWTGESRGSLRPIGQYLRVSVPIKVSPTAPGDRSALGQSEQHFAFEVVGGIYRFRWGTEVPHYLINEYYQSPLPLIQETPWKSLEAGEAAFRNYVANVLPGRLPRILDHIRVTVVKGA